MGVELSLFILGANLELVAVAVEGEASLFV